jgi:hypothetical protein
MDVGLHGFFQLFRIKKLKIFCHAEFTKIINSLEIGYKIDA